MHWPFGFKVFSYFLPVLRNFKFDTFEYFLKENTESIYPVEDGKFAYSDVHYLETYKVSVLSRHLIT